MFEYKKCLFFVVLLVVVVWNVAADTRSRKKNDYPDSTLWKKEFEDELKDAMLSSRRRENVTRVVQSPVPGVVSDSEVVVEKLMDSLTASEKYLKKVESIDFRLNRLDIEIHEKTNNIFKLLVELVKAVQSHDSNRIGTKIDSVKGEIIKIKTMVERCPITSLVRGPAQRMDSSVDDRLSYIEGNIKIIMNGVNSITNTISEVKSRQYARTSQKSDSGSVLDTMSILSEFRRGLYEQKMKKCDCKNGRVDRSERYPTDCHEIKMQGFNVSGIYKIKPDDMEPFYVLCDLTTSGGGWTVFQNRFDGTQDFYRTWNDYKHGFGNLAGEFWLGLEQLHYLTNQKLYELRIDIETQLGHESFAMYSVFTLGPEHEGYRISTLGSYHGTAGDSLSYHAGQKFSTFDVDKDEWKDGSCAVEHGGAWWYKECDKSNLNGKYSKLPTQTEENRSQIIYWISFKGPNVALSKTKMMIRPLPASRPNDFYIPSKLQKIPISAKGKAFRVTDKNAPVMKDGKIKGYDLTPNHQYYDEAPPVNPFFNNY